MFLAAVRKLPAALQHALHEAELDDAGLLLVYPRTHWRALGLPPRGTWHEGRARSSPPMAQATTVSSTVSLSVPPTLPLPSFSSPLLCCSPVLSLVVCVLCSLVKRRLMSVPLRLQGQALWRGDIWTIVEKLLAVARTSVLAETDRGMQQVDELLGRVTGSRRRAPFALKRETWIMKLATLKARYWVLW